MRPAELRVEFAGEASPPVCAARGVPIHSMGSVHRRIVEAIEELRIDFANARDHLADHQRALRSACRDAADMRHSRCSTMPDSVCTMVVKAATGRT